MSRPRGVRRLFRIRKRGWIEEAVDAELEHHLEMRVDELVGEGMRPEEARRAAEASFGDRGRYRAACVAERRREARMSGTREWLGNVAADVRYALRGIRKAPAFAVAVVMTLGLGIGANTAIFTVVDTLLIRDLPYPRPDELHQMGALMEDGFRLPGFSPATAVAFREASAGMSRPYLSARVGVVRSDGPEPVTLNVEAIEPGFTDMLGMAPEVGRPFNVGDAEPGATPVAILSHGFWMSALGGDPSVVGRTVVLDGVSYTVVGVMPRAFRYPLFGTTHLYVTLATDGTLFGRDPGTLRVWLRVPPSSVDRVTEAAEAFVAGYLERNPGGPAWTPTLEPLSRWRANPDVRQALYVTLGAVSVLFLVALVNGINLMLVRGTVRAREIGVRLALGGGRGRIMAQLLTESLLLALMSGGVAVALGTVGVDALWAMAPRDLTFFAPEQVSVDRRVIGFVAIVSVATGLALGLLPALRSVTLADATSSASLGAHGNLGRTRHRSRSLMVIAQVALSLILLFGAGLLGRSFLRLTDQHPGMDVKGLVSVDIQLSEARYPTPEERAVFVARLREKLERIPGVVALTGGHGGLPGTGITFSDGLYLEGESDPVRPGDLVLPFAQADPSLRTTLGTALLAGRDFSDLDVPSDRRVLATAALARRLGAESPAEAVGLRFSLDAGGRAYEIIGVVEDVRLEGLDPMFAREGFLRLDDPSRPSSLVGFLMRAERGTAPVIEAVRAAVHEVDPGQPVFHLGTVGDRMRESVAKPKFFLTLMLVFAAVALTLAGIGLYGVLSFAVSQRVREMGIRVALGAGSGEVRRLVLTGGLRLAVVGASMGTAVALYASKVLKGLLFETSARDLGVLVVTAALLLSVAAVASWVPARRATRLDPARVLNSE